jgi:hypothetical protein
MKQTLLTIAAGVLLTAPALAQFQAFGGFSGGVYVAAGDLDADGLGDIVLIDSKTGHFAAGFGQSSGGITWQTPRQIPSSRFRFITATVCWYSEARPRAAERWP